MDIYESSSRDPYEAIIDFEAGDHDDWNDTEEIELGSEEHDLFLRDSYVEPSNKDIQPFRVVQSTDHRDSGATAEGATPSAYRSQPCKQPLLDDDNISYSKFQIEDSGIGSGSTSSVVYQVPNYEQFAGSLAPSGPASMVASLIIILLILSVTILPIILPHGSTDDDPDFPANDVIKKYLSSTNAEHADARCKCICPPLVEHDKKQPNSSQTKATSTDQRRLYLGNTEPNKCNCANIVQPHLVDIKANIVSNFCVSCQCKYQNRNTTTIRRIVIFFSAVLITLTFYMLVQYLLKYFRITRRNLPPRWRWLSHQITDTD